MFRVLPVNWSPAGSPPADVGKAEGLIQSDKVVLKSRRPISRERPFDSDAAGKAPVALLVEMATGAPSIVRLGLFDPTQAPPPLP